jgi:hypothetical protein
MPAQDARSPAVGNRAGSAPISARIFGCPGADARDGGDQVELSSKGPDHAVDLLTEPVFDRGGRIDAVEHRADQERVPIGY